MLEQERQHFIQWGPEQKFKKSQYFLKHSKMKAHQAPKTIFTTFKVTFINFLPHSDAGFDLQQVNCSISVWLNALGCSHVIGWLAICTNKQLNILPNRVAGITSGTLLWNWCNRPQQSGWGHFQWLFLPQLLWVNFSHQHLPLLCWVWPDPEPSIPLRTGLMWKLKLPLL